MHEPKHRNPHFLHHQHSFIHLYGREIMFGMQDGMVSLSGALTGIAVGSNDRFTILLAGLSIIFTAALSMAIGTYNSLVTETKIEKRILAEEKEEIESSLIEEKEEVIELFIADGWPEEISQKMAECAARDNNLMLKEMAYRELGVVPNRFKRPLYKAVIMFVAWMLGGLFPLMPYLIFPVAVAIIISVIMALIGLFCLGAAMSNFTKQKVILAGLEIMIIGGVAMALGFVVGHFVDIFTLR